MGSYGEAELIELGQEIEAGLTGSEGDPEVCVRCGHACAHIGCNYHPLVATADGLVCVDQADCERRAYPC